MTIRSFDSAEEMIAEMEKSREAADARVDPKQEAIKVGDCFMRWAPEADLVIYGEVLDPLEWYRDKDLDANEGELRAEMEFEKATRAAPHMKHFRHTRCYSPVVEEGEFGDVHVATMMPIPREVFETAKTAGWPQDFSDDVPGTVQLAVLALFQGVGLIGGGDQS
jgi:hypothetical protein